MALSYIFYVLN